MKPFDKLPRKRIPLDPEDLEKLRMGNYNHQTTPETEMKLLTASDYEHTLTAGASYFWEDLWIATAFRFVRSLATQLAKPFGPFGGTVKAKTNLLFKVRDDEIVVDVMLVMKANFTKNQIELEIQPKSRLSNVTLKPLPLNIDYNTSLTANDISVRLYRWMMQNNLTQTQSK